MIFKSRFHCKTCAYTSTSTTSSEYFLSHSLFITSFEITLAYLLLRSPSRPVLTFFHVPVFLGAYFAFFSRSVCGCSRSWLAVAAGVRMLCCSSPWSTGPRASRSAGRAHPCAAAGAGVKQGHFVRTERVGLCSCLRGRLHGLGHGGVQCPCKRGAGKQLPVCKRC